jgi:hypothetical protein
LSFGLCTTCLQGHCASCSGVCASCQMAQPIHLWTRNRDEPHYKQTIHISRVL